MLFQDSYSKFETLLVIEMLFQVYLEHEHRDTA